MSKPWPYLRPRLPWMAVSAFLALLFTWSHQRPASHSGLDLALTLSQSSDLKVESYAWEPSRGVVLDYLWGRPVLFEARAPNFAIDQEEAPRDIYRAFVRLSPEARVLNIGQAYNITHTSHSDEQQLTVLDTTAYFGAESKHAPPSLSVLDLKGASRPARISFIERIQVGLSHFLETGSWAGLGRVDILAKQADDALQLHVDSNAVTLSAALSDIQEEHVLTNSILTTGPQNSTLDWIERTKNPVPWLHFAANTARDKFGVKAVAWLESQVFSTLDQVKRTGYSLSHSPSPVPAPRPLIAAADGDTTVIWPPPDIAGLTSKKGEGKWKPVTSRLLPPDKTPLFYKTVLYPDSERPYAELHLVAFDMRRLQLGMRAGYEDPEPQTGPKGSGQLPEDEASRVVATFNGAFKAAHGGYGMKAEGRVLSKPRVGAATVRVDHDGRIGLGTWKQTDSVDDTLQLRQNLDPLVENGKANPTGRRAWGDHVDLAGVAVERSALCLHDSGHLLYAWATEATGESLASGLEQAGCVYAIHLDMNPGHCAFLINRITSVRPLKAEGEALDPRMKVNTTRYVRWSPKDFFYLSLPSPLPDDGHHQWSLAPGTQPSEPQLPGIFIANKSLGEIRIQIDRVQPERLSFALKVGQSETLGRPDASSLATEDLTAPSDEMHGAVLIAWGLGHRTHGKRPGLSHGLHVISPMSRTFATLVVEPEKGLRLLPPGEPLPESERYDLLQLPVLARDGRLVSAAEELGGLRSRSALCVRGDGVFLVGRIEHDTIAPLVQTLIDGGCELVAEMDRGSHSPALVRRLGTQQPPLIGHQQSILYGIDRKMQPRTYSF